MTRAFCISDELIFHEKHETFFTYKNWGHMIKDIAIIIEVWLELPHEETLQMVTRYKSIAQLGDSTSCLNFNYFW